jgi:hypothetical protein
MLRELNRERRTVFRPVSHRANLTQVGESYPICTKRWFTHFGEEVADESLFVD